MSAPTTVAPGGTAESKFEPGTQQLNRGESARSAFAVGRPSRPNPSANPVGGHGRRSNSSVETHLRWTRRPSRLVRLLVATLGGLSLALGITGHAHADPTPAEIEKQIDEKWDQIEPVVEQHNKPKIEPA